MSVSIGGIDLAGSAINAELRLGVLERMVERLVKYVPAGSISQQDIENMRKEAFEELQKKYPNAGLQYSKT